ncbi:hypothetical protein BGW36DRAFT_297453 [Talaromyces proteolyticus]|uniref:Uncharacterized protein n=1 Tax=Talaromyces proteolyticus TaxID=1131652 RepID=A0AAD4KQR6_9EURO|nr:uncharacterized protein BGW36DRAFT_297453 [Talaromyces proteolyticus]KAH8696227.1 hypothetical protein BGW36DRAFT_297453 [Talaromyces proteolyticus]
MDKGAPSFPGFTALSDQIFIRQPDKENEDNSTHSKPHHVRATLIFGWGDAQPKNLVKYADGYRELNPDSTQIVVLAPISKAVYMSLEQRTQAMMPIVDALFPTSPNTQAEQTGMSQEHRILVHVMSNTGGIFLAATLNAYREVYNEPLPHDLLVLDSTPGSPVMTFKNLIIWSRGMTLGTANWFPWPFVVTQSLWGVFLSTNRFFEWLIGRVPASVFSVAALINEEFETKKARQLYLYSQEDELIPYEDIESHIAEAKIRGYDVDTCVFRGSKHVRHMQMFQDQYWHAIRNSWEDVTKNDK